MPDDVCGAVGPDDAQYCALQPEHEGDHGWKYNPDRMSHLEILDAYLDGCTASLGPDPAAYARRSLRAIEDKLNWLEGEFRALGRS